jgi:hypothetical protein
MIKRLSEPEIDQIVIAQADDNTAWDEPELSLDALLAQVTEANRHSETSTGTAFGREVW